MPDIVCSSLRTGIIILSSGTRAKGLISPWLAVIGCGLGCFPVYIYRHYIWNEINEVEK